MALTLGTKPEGLRVYLNPGADLMFSIRSVSSPWAPSIRLVLEIGTMQFEAKISSPRWDIATFIIDQDEVDAALAQSDLTAKLWYIDPVDGTRESEVRLLLAKGVAVRSG